jgi:hypothetical protein
MEMIDVAKGESGVNGSVLMFSVMYRAHMAA